MFLQTSPTELCEALLRLYQNIEVAAAKRFGVASKKQLNVVFAQRNRPKQEVEGRSRRLTRNDYATVEGNFFVLRPEVVQGYYERKKTEKENEILI